MHVIIKCVWIPNVGASLVSCAWMCVSVCVFVYPSYCRDTCSSCTLDSPDETCDLLLVSSAATDPPEPCVDVDEVDETGWRASEAQYRGAVLVPSVVCSWHMCVWFMHHVHGEERTVKNEWMWYPCWQMSVRKHIFVSYTNGSEGAEVNGVLRHVHWWTFIGSDSAMMVCYVVMNI